MAAKAYKKSGGARVWHRAVVTVILIFMLLPLAVTFLFSISTVWESTVLPEGYTLAAYGHLFSEERFLQALGRSLEVAFITVAFSLIVMVPTIFIVSLYLPRLERLLQAVVLLPFAVPGVVAAVGLLKIYANPPFAITGTLWILIGVYFVIILPYVYQSTRNSLRSVNATELMEAAEVLGAGKTSAFLRVILPNIRPGILVASLLSLSTIFGEFVLANMLVGGSYEVLQVYLIQLKGRDGHLSSATIVTFFVIIFIFFSLLLKFANWKPQMKSPSDGGKEEPA